MINPPLILFGKVLAKAAQVMNLGHGSTWPGHLALKINKHFVQQLIQTTKMKTILVAGTNGKTTTSSLIKCALENNGKKVIQNESGANLLNGIASTLLLHATIRGNLAYDYAIFEVDENALPKVLTEMQPDYLVLLNLFRDQLDRYGEVNTIVANWKRAIEKLSKKTTLILNADDPQVASLGEKQTTVYFGLQPSQFSTKSIEHAADSVFCPNCNKKLTFTHVAFSHLGDWKCNTCGLKRPAITGQTPSSPDQIGIQSGQTKTVYPLPGLYNKYNTLAAKCVLDAIGLSDQQINDSFLTFTPAFGRQEIINYKNHHVQLFLSKNPTSFNQSYQTIKELGGKTILIVLNDRIPDGRDISWIWDVDFPDIQSVKNIIIAGDRAIDMGLRIKYEEYKNYQIYNDLEQAIDAGVTSLRDNETLFILPTYSAMLEVRKILTGKKIL